MNRSIKFRVWDVKIEKYVTQLDRYFGLDWNGELRCLHSARENHPFAIQQFTGILDKTGKEIYEGDIVKFQWEAFEFDLRESMGEVYFENGIFFFSRVHEFATNDSNFLHKTLEVIGNIFENKDLLK